MKNSFLKFVAIFLTLVTFLTCFAISSSAWFSESSNSEPSNDDEVLEMTIFATDGHAFLYFYNISEYTLNVYGNEVVPGDGITIGTFTNTDIDGVNINVEAIEIIECNGYQNRYSITKIITYGDLQTVNEEMEANNQWTKKYNCAFFATTVWNSVAESEETLSCGSIPSPATLRTNIKTMSNYEKDKSITVSINTGSIQSTSSSSSSSNQSSTNSSISSRKSSNNSSSSSSSSSGVGTVVSWLAHLYNCIFG